MPWRSARAQARASCGRPPGGCPAHASARRLAAPEPLAHGAVARQRSGAGEHQVAEAREPRERVGTPAERHREARDLGEAARDERRHGVVAVAEAVDDAGRDRDHVLQGAGQLDAHHVLARVDAEAARRERALDALGDGVVRCGHHHRGRQRLRHLERRRTGPRARRAGGRAPRPPPPRSCAAACRSRAPWWRRRSWHPRAPGGRPAGRSRGRTPTGSRPAPSRRRRAASREARWSRAGPRAARRRAGRRGSRDAR